MNYFHYFHFAHKVLGWDVENLCEEGWEEFEANCYLKSNNSMLSNWYQAEEYCSYQNSHLISIHSEEENNFIYDLLLTNGTTYSGIWTGLHMVINWRWTDFSPFSFDDFQDGYPAGGGNCVALDTKWSDSSCKDTKKYICEKYTIGFCLNGWNKTLYSPRICYYLSNDQQTWQDASAECGKLGANLTAINDEYENSNLTEFIKTWKAGNTYWIGLYTKPATWIDNTDIVFENYTRGEPDGDGSCLLVSSDGWEDNPCSANIYYICKKIATRDCGEGWLNTTFNNNCYYFSSVEADNWYHAKEICENKTSYLVTILDSAENIFIQDVVNNNTYSRNYWIGVNTWLDQAVWSDNSKYNYDNMFDGRPDGISACVFAGDMINQLLWLDDVACNDSLGYICKKTAQGHCKAETLPFRNNSSMPVMFPTTYSGYSNVTLEKCSEESSDFQGFPYGSRFCNLSAIWEDPVWISSCNKNLEMINVTADNVEEVARDVSVITSQPQILSINDVQVALNIVQQSLTFSTDQQVSEFYIATMSNLIQWTNTNEDEKISKEILNVIDNISSEVEVETSPFFHTSPQLSVHVDHYNQNPSTSAMGVEFVPIEVQRVFGFRQGQISFLNNCSLHSSNQSQICVRQNETERSTGERISFYAFLNDAVFQGSDDVINSDVILSATTGLKNIHVQMKFNTKQINPNYPSRCAFWDEIEHRWVEFTSTESSDLYVECQMDHLTNFASLLGYKVDVFGLDVVTLVGCILSLLCQIATIIFYFKTKEKCKSKIYGTARGMILCNFAFALCFLNLFILISEISEIRQSPIGCQVIAILVHFALFSTFTWMLADTFNIYMGTNHPLVYRFQLELKKYVGVIMLISWGFPVAFVASFAVKHPEIYGLVELNSQCWMEYEWNIYLVVIPISVFLSINLILFACILYAARFKSRPTGQKAYEKIETIKFAMLLFFMVGGTWIIGLVIIPMANLSHKAGLAFAYIFAIIDSLQGALLFLLQYMRTWKDKIVNSPKKASNPHVSNELKNLDDKSD